MKGKYIPAAGIGIEQTGEARLDSGALIQKWQWAAWCGNLRRQSFAVCPSNPVSVLPSFFASITPAAAPSTNNR